MTNANYSVQIFDGVNWKTEHEEVTLSEARLIKKHATVHFGLKARIVTDSGLIVE